MSRFAKKVVLVTGARSGIGLACATRFAEEGARVFAAQRGDADGFETIHADFNDTASLPVVVQSVVDAAGRLDVLINNAGMMEEASAENTSLEMWERTLRINLTAPFLLIKHALPHLKNSSGSIVNIGSVEGLGSNLGHAAYGASKAGLHGLTRAVAVDHGPDGVRCNAVAPGWIDTPLNKNFIASMPNPDQFRSRLGDIHPVGHTGTPENVAALVAWLASADAAFVTGQVYAIDGGRTAKLSLP